MQGLLGILVSAGVFVDLHQREVVAGLVRLNLHHFLDDRFGLLGGFSFSGP